MSMWRRWLERTNYYHLDGFAMCLGVDTDALKALGCTWANDAWAFPSEGGERHHVGSK